MFKKQRALFVSFLLISVFDAYGSAGGYTFLSPMAKFMDIVTGPIVGLVAFAAVCFCGFRMMSGQTEGMQKLALGIVLGVGVVIGGASLVKLITGLTPGLVF